MLDGIVRLEKHHRDAVSLERRISDMQNDLDRFAVSVAELAFIADDILQTFDDARAGDTLQVLGKLSNYLQVIVLTHHGHLPGIAADLGDKRIHLISL